MNPKTHRLCYSIAGYSKQVELTIPASDDIRTVVEAYLRERLPNSEINYSVYVIGKEFTQGAVVIGKLP